MRKSFILFRPLIFFLLAFFPMKEVAAGKSEKIVIRTNIYCDHCMECETCGLMLKNELRYLKGVKFTTIDPKAMTFTIEYNPSKTSPEALRLAISKLGYDADHVKADPEAVKKLDGCCRKPE